MARLKQNKINSLTDVETLKKYKTYLKYCGVYMDDYNVSRIYVTNIYIYSSVFIILLLISIYVFLDDTDKVAIVSHHLLFAIDIAGVCSIFSSGRRVLLTLIDAVSCSYDYYSEVVYKYIAETEKEREKKINTIVKYLWRLTSYAVLNVTLASFLEKYMTGSRHLLLFPCWFPFDLDYVVFNMIAYLLQFVGVVLACFTSFGTLALVYIIYNHIIAELKLLEYSLEKTFERAEELVKSKKEGNLTMKEACILCVRHCGAHHVEILKYFEDANSLLKYLYMYIFGSGLGMCTISGFALLSDNTALKVKFVSITLLQLSVFYILCWCGEAISAESNEIRGSIYGIAWYDMPKECHSIFYIMVERAKKPLTFDTGFGMKADLDSYMSLIKASYSYFNMILATQSH